jgi:endonuclease YncB( thermonuclease family)
MATLACFMAVRKYLLTAAVWVLATLFWGPPASAAIVAPCGVGAGSPVCHFWNGKVTFIGDGDTISVDLAGHKGERPVRVRITGIQAMEEHVYTDNPADRTGECHANEATARLEHLVKASKGKVRLAAQDQYSRSGNRLRRQVSVRINGRWRDVGRTLLSEGHALALPNPVEWAWNASYSLLSQRAAAQRIGLWDPTYCGPGPEPFANLRLWVNSDAEGSDESNPDGEFVRLKNMDPVNPVPIGNWWVRDSGLRRYTLPPTATVPAGGEITVYVGEGEDTATEFFWGIRGGVFDNVTQNGHGGGDGAYLFDPEGDLRASMIYPCRYNCVDPLQNALQVSAHPRGSEYVTVTNVSASPVDLEGYQLRTAMHGYPFPPGSTLQPGESLRVETRGDPGDDTPLLKHWGLDSLILPNGGGSVKLSTFTYVDLACDSWGSGSCSK